ncbi:MoxR family ATPase [bacterium]|nr:MoxR family ATPase [bacterium]
MEQAPIKPEVSVSEIGQKCEQSIIQIGRVVLGKKEQIRMALTCLFARGHLLIEDIPGIGKTTLAKVLAICLGLKFRRIQCTSDMLPGDILGVSIFEQKTGLFVFHPGPVFTQVLLADEVNRATPKTQSALLEAMEERQVTLDGQTRRLDEPFFVIATQNPREQSGTYPLPESQLDRFLMRIELGYPGRRAEQKLLQFGDTKGVIDEIEPCLNMDQVLQVQTMVNQVHVSTALFEYVQDLLDFSRQSGNFSVGLSPRAGLSIVQAARSWALLSGRNHVLPEDIQAVLLGVVGHRLRSPEDLREIPREKLANLFQQVAIP